MYPRRYIEPFGVDLGSCVVLYEGEEQLGYGASSVVLPAVLVDGKGERRAVVVKCIFSDCQEECAAARNEVKISLRVRNGEHIITTIVGLDLCRDCAPGGNEVNAVECNVQRRVQRWFVGALRAFGRLFLSLADHVEDADSGSLYRIVPLGGQTRMIGRPATLWMNNAGILGKVQGKHVCQMLVSEKMDMTLQEYIFFGEGKSYTYLDLLDIALMVAKAIQELHSNNILHCDISLKNILRSVSGNVVLSDFGASEILEDLEHGIVASSKGTRGYVAPEMQVWGWQNECLITPEVPTRLGVLTQVYSLGIVLLQLFTRLEIGATGSNEGNCSIFVGGIRNVKVSCTLEGEVATIIEDCLKFDLEQCENGQFGYGRPPFTEIIKRLTDLKTREWATSIVPAYMKKE